jgi:hypothetical protein
VRFGTREKEQVATVARVSSLHRVARVLAALCAVAAVAGGVAGCGGGTDLARVTFQRSTVPARPGEQTTDPGDDGESGSGSPVTNPGDSAFTAAKLRAVDPCGLLDNDTLGAFGTPADADPGGIDECDDFMHDSAGDDLDIDLTVGEQLDEVDSTTSTADGLPVAEDKASDGKACFEKIVTQTSPTLGLELQIDYDGHDPCVPARKLAAAIVSHIRIDPPHRANAAGSLALVDPCGTLDTGTATTVLGAKPDEVEAEGLFECDWRSSGFDVTVGFSVDEDPKSDTSGGTPKPVNIGVPAYEFPSTDVFPSCEVKWTTRASVDSDGNGEVVDVEYDNIDNAPKVDTCAKAVAAAKAVVRKVPHSG